MSSITPEQTLEPSTPEQILKPSFAARRLVPFWSVRLRPLQGVVRPVVEPFHWLFVRLPKGFTLPLLVIAAVYFLYMFPLLVVLVGDPVYHQFGHQKAELINDIGELGRLYLTGALSLWDVGREVLHTVTVVAFAVLAPIVFALLILGGAVAGVLLSHALAGKVYLQYRQRSRRPAAPPVPVVPACAAGAEVDEASPLARYQKIGIILSGGGAKGAYQAGAMQAVYEFLGEHNAHHKVKMIAGTSIGSWNALFWLAGLMQGRGTRQSPIREWWSSVNVQNVIMPVTYVPTRQNYFLSNDPWKENFDALFRGTEAGRRLLQHIRHPGEPGSMNFYFTRSNICKAKLAYTTNRRDWDEVTPNLPVGEPQFQKDLRYPAHCERHDDCLEHVRTGVFSSMDIPPLFQYSIDDADYFEDGGVIDNLPIRFGTEVEGCDLLFILPLNASFEKEVDQRSVIRRLARVTEIRQGVLERNSFKMIYLYNELASLRKRVEELQAPPPTGNTADLKALSESKTADRALKRTHDVVHVFSVCPAPQLKITTTEFWKTREAGEAFDFMYHATKNELKRFGHLVNSKWIRMALISPAADGAPVTTDDGTGAAAAADSTAAEMSGHQICKTTDGATYNVTYFKDF